MIQGGSTLKQEIIELLHRIPYGRVAYYGQLAQGLTLARERHVSAQLVGWQLSAFSPEQQLMYPWWRVVAKNGSLPSYKLGERGQIQHNRLSMEGIIVHDGKVPMDVFCVENSLFL